MHLGTNKLSDTIMTIERQIVNSDRCTNLITATKRFNRLREPTNAEVDMHLKNGGLLEDSWIIGTGVVCERPGERLRKEVEVDGLRFEVPHKYRGLADTLLIFQSGFRINKKGLYTGEVTDVIDEFPALDGWYKADAKTGIPQGKTISDDDPEARYLFRRYGKYIGAVTRGSDDYSDVFWDGRIVEIFYKPSCDDFRVALFSRRKPRDFTAESPVPSILVILRLAESPIM